MPRPPHRRPSKPSKRAPAGRPPKNRPRPKVIEEEEPDLEFNEEDQFSLGVLRTPRPEQYLIDFWKTTPVASALCTSLGRAQFAAHLAEHSPEARIACNFLDLYAAGESRDIHQNSRPNLSISCEPDLPSGVYDLCAMPVSRGGEAELTREFLQQCHQHLKDGGTMLASSDNWKDTWLRDELTAIFSSVEKHSCRGGVVYTAKKKGALKRVRDFSAEFAFRDEGRLIKAFSRPGVFSHRKLDLGARALLEVMQVQTGDRVLDIGCGSGVVGLAAAQRAENVSVLAIDSNCRAVACSRRGAELNGLTAYEARLEANGQIDAPGQFEVAVGNPPYYSQYKIANLFLMAAHTALKPGGRVYMVTKHADWFDARMRQLFDDVELLPSREYIVVTGRKR